MSGREISLGRSVILIALAAVMGCGGGAADNAEADSDTAVAAEQEAAPAQENAAAEQASAEQSGPMTLTADDLESYRKGRLAEIEDVKKKIATLSAAKNESDSMNAMFALTNEGDRTKAGASAAGMDVSAYGRLTSAVDNVLGAWRVSEMMKGSTDTSARAGLARLPQSNVKLVVPRAAELDSLRLIPPALALKAVGA